MNGVKSEFYNAVLLDLGSRPKYSGKWYGVRINPLPLSNLEHVVSDIISESQVSVGASTRVAHLNTCRNTIHDLDDEIRVILTELRDIQFKVLIREPIINKDGSEVYSGQPFVVVLDPVVNHATYPEHPHINGFTHMKLPSTLCYSEDFSPIRNLILDKKIVYAIQQSSIYLLKHLIWVILKDTVIEKPWIAPDAAQLLDVEMIQLLNPDGICHCGSGKKYKKCCLKKSYLKKTRREITGDVICNLGVSWRNHNRFENAFREYFLPIFDSQVPMI